MNFSIKREITTCACSMLTRTNNPKVQRAETIFNMVLWNSGNL